MDMTPQAIADVIGQLIAPALVPVIGYLLALLRTWHINATVLRAVARGAGAAYLSMVESRRGVTSAVDAGAAYVETRVPDTLRKAGLDSGAVKQLVRGELGKLLAADPTVGPAKKG